VLAGTLGGAVVVAGLLLSGAAAGPLSPTALTPTERNALRIVSVRAVGAEGGGLVVTVTFAGNLEKAIGRGHLKTALVAVILRPKDASFATADLATEGAGPIGLTSKKSRSKAVGVVRNGRTFTFFIAGPGSSNVGKVDVKSFVSAPGRKPARTTAGRSVSPDQWDDIERDIAFAEQLAILDEAFANGPLDCAGLRKMLDTVLADLARARIRQQDLQDLGKRVDAQIARVQDLVGLNATFAEAAAHTILAPYELARNLLTGESTSQQVQSWKDVLRSLKLDRRLVDAYLARNQKLIEHLSELKGRLEGLHKAQCNDSGTTTPPAPAKTFGVGVRTSYTHPGGSTSTFCVLVTTTPPKPGASAKVHVAGPGVVGPADQTKTLDAAGKAVANVTIKAYGEYTATADVTAGTETVSGTDSKEVKPEQATCPPP
jgi:hypothetical protein